MQDVGTEICCIASAAEAFERFMSQEYCLVIIDFQMPEMDGIKMIRAIKAVKNAPVLVLTKPLESSVKVALFQAGANACIEKPVDITVCAAQAASLIQLYTASSSGSKDCGPLAFGTELIIDPLYRQVIVDGIPIALTKTEFDLLFCLASHPGYVWSRDQLYRRVWNEALEAGSENTVRAHIGNLHKKLAGKKYIQSVRGIGYRFEAPKTDKHHKNI